MLGLLRHGLPEGLQMTLPGGMGALLMAIFNIHLWAKHIDEDIL